MERSLNGVISTRIILFIITFILIQEATCFNYDYSSACTRPYRSGRTNVKVAPCDLSKQTYCNHPGSTYPWHAVRRFVHENQGLMRRMYGDQRHIAVLKAEIENNDLDADLFQIPVRDSTFARYSKDWEVLNTKFVYSKKPAGRSNEQFTVPHFRPVQTTQTSSTSKNEEVTSPKTSKKETDDLKLAAYKTSFFEDEMNVRDTGKTNLDMNKIEPEIVTLDGAIKLETNNVYSNFNATNKTVTVRPTTINVTVEASSVAESTTTEYATMETTSDFGDQSTEDENGGWKPVTGDKISTLPPNMLFSQSMKEEINKNDRIDLNVNENYKTQDQGQTTGNSGTTSHTGQLFQDVVHEEMKPVMKLRGVNACPVKEEVVAPFWANNTRGEVLALLNLYPFEQYVHWEKCTHEHRQMFCREGCRCEQQYRLHRLLAYDPNNECRGIFSDWFRFPSCCVCKCYDVPLEFRVTSRSPRTIPDLEETVRKEMYQNAASDWYTINLDD